MPLAAVVADRRWSAAMQLEGGRGGWLAEDWTYRFLGAALAQRLDEPDEPTIRTGRRPRR